LRTDAERRERQPGTRNRIGKVTPFHRTKNETILLGDSLEYMASLQLESLDLIMTSPPFGLVRKKDYGNVESHEYVDWFERFAEQFKRLLKPSGSLVIDIGGAWIPGPSALGAHV
jgi:DNA modification methylase